MTHTYTTPATKLPFVRFLDLYFLCDTGSLPNIITHHALETRFPHLPLTPITDQITSATGDAEIITHSVQLPIEDQMITFLVSKEIPYNILGMAPCQI